jgi:hypothetical protein
MISTELASAIQQTSKELDALINTSMQKETSASHLEVIKQKCVTLFDLLLQIKTETSPVEETEIQQARIVPVIEPPIITPTLFSAPTLLVNDIPPITVEPQIVVEPTQQEGPIKEVKTETELKNEWIDEIIEQKQEEEQTTPPIPLLKEVINELSLHEKIASVLPPKADLAEKLSTQISSLKSAINVNLKIAMVNELFNESSVEYVKAIDKLNTSENIHEAMRYFSELKHTYTWDSENSLVKELEVLITKRYS